MRPVLLRRFHALAERVDVMLIVILMIAFALFALLAALSTKKENPRYGLCIICCVLLLVILLIIGFVL